MNQGSERLPRWIAFGAGVFYRRGTFYFLRSEGPTRSETYRVCYATANFPAGALYISDDNL